MLHFVTVIEDWLCIAVEHTVDHKMKCKFAVLIALDIKDCIKGNIKEHKEFSLLPGNIEQTNLLMLITMNEDMHYYHE